MLEQLIQLRKELHRHPELSGSEFTTAKRIHDFIQQHHPTQIISGIGGSGLAAIYTFSDQGPTIGIRCELDALPIQETNHFEHRSNHDGISHKCGHDGHMAIVAGLIFWLKEQSFKTGKVILLFQPAEETGKGAQSVIEDERFKALSIDYLFALHNIPGTALQHIITMHSGFSAVVQSFSASFLGKEAHAAEPENGINPAFGMSQIIAELDNLNNDQPESQEFTVLTPVFIEMGKKAYGVSPANGELHYTIRTWDTDQMNTLKDKIDAVIRQNCLKHGLEYNLDWFEYFPASTNHKEAINFVKEGAAVNGFQLEERPYPFKFGEDFGWFSSKYKTAMFGLGSGLETPALHHADYDFPDEIIETGVKMFGSIIKLILK